MDYIRRTEGEIFKDVIVWHVHSCARPRLLKFFFRERGCSFYDPGTHANIIFIKYCTVLCF